MTLTSEHAAEGKEAADLRCTSVPGLLSLICARRFPGISLHQQQSSLTSTCLMVKGGVLLCAGLVVCGLMLHRRFVCFLIE